MARGYAAVSSAGEILVNTVSETERAAKVNWLVVCGQIPITCMHSDDDIHRLFEEWGVAVVSVRIVEPD